MNGEQLSEESVKAAPKKFTLAEAEAQIGDLTALVEDIQARGGTGDKPTVFESWNRVMRDVQAIRKDSYNSGQKFNFRGIDAVMNAVGPALREHGVTVVPRALSAEAERYQTAKGGQMCNRTVEMGFRVFGPAGDYFDGTAYGEAADSGDKSMTKAESVALRTFLLQSLMIPTDDPDPDAESHERATPATAARLQAPVPVGNADSAKARAELKELAGQKGWDLNAIADKFAADNNGKLLKDATGEEVTAYKNLLETGAVTV
ncbi:ERF family ssDNA binding protein [Mycobacterium phage Krypton555]|uniref:ERF family ssDNA binding protein n=1 Tax=Mycobacterium phage Krypton555 TaxID=2015885 RepID=A0A222ZRS7_9CAUD|nr:ERF family ssDNA binding protein [Mycobacterium phage Krypton555]ASR87099.1 ERF family ssDNA binding protein [Mycobacterium phage Krypton555]